MRAPTLDQGQRVTVVAAVVAGDVEHAQHPAARIDDRRGGAGQEAVALQVVLARVHDARRAPRRVPCRWHWCRATARSSSRRGAAPRDAARSTKPGSPSDVQQHALRVGQDDHAVGVADLLEQELHHRPRVRDQFDAGAPARAPSCAAEACGAPGSAAAGRRPIALQLRCQLLSQAGASSAASTLARYRSNWRRASRSLCGGCRIGKAWLAHDRVSVRPLSWTALCAQAQPRAADSITGKAVQQESRPRLSCFVTGVRAGQPVHAVCRAGTPGSCARSGRSAAHAGWHAACVGVSPVPRSTRFARPSIHIRTETRSCFTPSPTPPDAKIQLQARVRQLHQRQVRRRR